MLLEGNVDSPQEDARRAHLIRTRAWSLHPWKGLARYYTVAAGGQENRNGACCCPHPSPLAHRIKDHVAFRNDVQVDLAGRPDQASVAG